MIPSLGGLSVVMKSEDNEEGAIQSERTLRLRSGRDLRVEAKEERAVVLERVTRE